MSRRLSYWLRHRPEAGGLALDEGGWAPVPAVLSALARSGLPVSARELAAVVATDDKQRYALDGDRIRANQGHTVPVELDLPAVEPPPVLWHGTVARALPGIRAEGLTPRGRHAVHLSPDGATARAVGARRGEPVVLRVDAERMAADGWTFRRSANGVWLVDAVPPTYLRAADG